ncbi:methylated-DNA--[protein]-cysteine S-methyltransferase [Lactobacillus sp. DCY120]|uniref:methylated-DNA--[protein]-cysteine S-methyltransferase n=1 Tax=Bombilactobacillus apium TaxID=2675299 RepID=A0A850R351_9LACO|nr:methylated-DNA--[protein]-cysteine S-methyltransferase [Bombilactobacillus apium]
MFYQQLVPGPLEDLTIIADDQKLYGIWFQGQKYFAAHLPLAEVAPQANQLTQQTALWLQQYFAGQQPTQTLPALAWEQLTPFRQRVGHLLCQIPYGQTCSYQDLAQQLGGFNYARAAARAVGHNPFSIIVPCHRVLGKDHSLIGYAGGLAQKRWLLDWEQAHC